MKKVILVFLSGLLTGMVAGFAAGILVFPFWFPPPEINETVVNRDPGEVVARGQFIHADPSDPLHYGRGGVRQYPDLLHMEADFEVGPGPKYHVYLLPDADVTPDTPVQERMFVDLGRLKAFKGSQNYAIPAGIDWSDYQSVVIWCEYFEVLISPARLQAQKAGR